MPGKDLPLLATSPNMTSPWATVAESLIELTVEISKFSGAGPAVKTAVKAMKALAGVEEAQVIMLQEILSDVQLIRTGPFHAARQHLETAIRKAETGTEYAHNLQAAEDLLIQALGQCASVEESSVIKFNLGVVAAIRGERGEAAHRLRDSYAECAKIADELSARAADVRVMGSPWAWAAMATSPLIIAAKKRSKVKKSHQATTVLQEYLPFVEVVAQAHNAIELEAVLPVPRLYGGKGKHFQLEWVGLER